jgi:LPS export ABC transporter protein LptC
MINQFLHIYLKRAAIIIGCFFIWACENDMNVVRDLGRKKAGIEEGKNIEIFLSANGKMRARLKAPLLLRYQGDSANKAVFPNTLHVDFFNDSMKIESQLNAKFGSYLENENKVYLRDNVIAFNIKGDTIFCEELYWDQTKEKYYTDKKVTISKNFRQALFIGLNGMTCKQDLSGLTLFNVSNTGSYTFIPDSTATPATGTLSATDSAGKKK